MTEKKYKLDDKKDDDLIEEQLKQLKTVFKAILDSYITIGSWNIEEVINKLLYEVKIRIPNK